MRKRKAIHNIQIFTDGGCFLNGRYTVSVFRMYDNCELFMKYENILYNKDSDFAELFAINKALSRLYGRIEGSIDKSIQYDISLYTDSKSSLYAVKNCDAWINPENKNRHMIVSEIRDMLSRYNQEIKIYHIRSHITGKQLHFEHDRFCEENDIKIPFNDFLFIYRMNKKCDTVVKQTFKQFRHHG